MPDQPPPRPRGRPPKDGALSGVERQRRYLDRLIAKAAAKAAQEAAAPPVAFDPETQIIVERAAWDRLTAALDTVKADRDKWQDQCCKAELASERNKPAPKPKPLDPDSELGRLKTANRNLRARLRNVIEWKNAPQGKMPFATYRAVAMALHPDQAAHSTVETREAALAMFTQWKQDLAGR
jgi:hypothetical protein